VTTFVVEERHLAKNPAAVQAFTVLAIQMIAHGCYFHDGWRVACDIINDGGTIRHKLRPLPPDG